MTTGPQARFLSERPGPSHVAYWCEDPVTSAEELLDAGGRLVLLALSDTSGWRSRLERNGPRALLPLSAATYIRLPGGLIIELNSRASRSRMVDTWGESVLATLPEMDPEG